MPEIDFSHYYTYDELTTFVHTIAEEHPTLAQVESIGKSHEGRDIWLVTLTNLATGLAREKPAYWIDANTHAGEVTGSAVALYTIWYATSKHGTDEQVTRLLDNHALYILPRITVDGSEKYLTTPYMLRSSTRRYPYEEDREGLQPEDIDGDGEILTMRIQDPTGNYKVSERDPRIMRRRDPDEYGGTYYHLLMEGRLHNWNGFDIKPAPPREGLDLNRNYPYEWAPEGIQRGAGPFPFSEPETRAEAAFWDTHRNINGFVTYHTFAGAILRPYSTQPDEAFDPNDLDVFKLIGQRGTDITGYPCVSVFHGFRYQPKEVLHGGMDDYAYDMLGWFGFTTELWDITTEAGIEQPREFIGWSKWHPEEDDVKLMEWNDRMLNGEGFVPWREFDHPQLGKVEIGGWRIKKVWQNAPVQFLPDLCDKHCRFTLAHAEMSPRLTVQECKAEALGGGLHKITLILRNTGFLPTYTSKKAAQIKVVRPIEVEVTLPEGVTLASGEREQEIGHLEGRSNKLWGGWFSAGYPTDNARRLEWVVAGPAGSVVKIETRSERAGSVRAEVALKSET
jgi:murein tripeptide amidase MpaA